MAGDWVAQGPGTHGAKGLSQEKAYVTGLQAGNQVTANDNTKSDENTMGSICVIYVTYYYDYDFIIIIYYCYVIDWASGFY